MPIDPSIPLGVRPIQIENPINALAQAQQIGVNALKMQEAQRSIDDRNMLRGLDPSSPDYIKQVGGVDPKLALALQKGQLDTRKNQAELENLYMKKARDTLAPINDQATYDLWRQQTSSQLPGISQFLPAKFDDKVKTSLMLEADKYIQQTQISAAQQQNANVTMRGQNMSESTARRGQDLQNAPNVVANTITDAAGNVTQFNRFGQIIGQPGAIGKPSATFEKTAALQKQQQKDLGLVITELERITKDGGLIDQSTGSGAGRAIDVTAGIFGQSTPGSEAIAQLRPIADMALKMVPRFEGPQSDKDTLSYKEASGQLADPSTPTKTRKAAGKEVLRLMKARKNQFVDQNMANEGIGAGAPALPPGFTPDK